MANGVVVVGTFIRISVRSHLAVSFRVQPGISPARQHLVGVGLVGDVPDDLVAGGVKDIVVGDGQFHDSQVRTQVAANRRVFLDDQVADF